MNTEFYSGNRMRLYDMMQENSLFVIFSGEEIRKSADANYLFFADRNFVYLTGIHQKQSILLAVKDEKGNVTERLYLLPKHMMEERWTGRRLSCEEAAALSGIQEVRVLDGFSADFHTLAASGAYENLYLDTFKQNIDDIDRSAHKFLQQIQSNFPHLTIKNANNLLRKLRTIKQPCEIEALRKAEQITKDGILAMMRASKPGMYEYQYKAEFDRAIGQYGPLGSGFQSIISAGSNNFCIHYDSYTGQAQDGDMVLNDVGAQWDDLIVDVSRGWPCNGKFTERQKLLYSCALETSDYMFSIICPGMKMADVDRTIREYNAQLLVKRGVMKDVSEVGKYMWHGGAHHIGFDVHDCVDMPEIIQAGMVFCVDVGIYHEEWGIGFRLEDNCLVTEDGCENLSSGIPRTIEEIEAFMEAR